ncbi:LysE family translocator [Paralimibaculum aggregatum]|uniref:LysE family translocator n=1 Tax=Paralimibaculum aggregatum TaxID=3036245 RepID=A0ABQ6LFZ5_9RHOB|nr:LysE family translocator [Limibaculum sp. NKW23]GMG80964.1 LysE family translocator [Limibaculum sp. NKW23]
MSGAELALLLLAWVLGGASPGPATMALASTGMSRGRAPALALAAGIVTGSAAWGVLAALGLGALMLTHAWAAEALRLAGAAYILWLAVKALRSAMRPGTPPPAAMARGGLWRVYLGGTLLHLTNPKAIFSWGAVYAVAVPADAGAAELASIGLMLMAGSVFVFFGYAWLFSTGAAMACYLRLRRWIEGAFGLLFGSAALALLTARPG